MVAVRGYLCDRAIACRKLICSLFDVSPYFCAALQTTGPKDIFGLDDPRVNDDDEAADMEGDAAAGGAVPPGPDADLWRQLGKHYTFAYLCAAVCWLVFGYVGYSAILFVHFLHRVVSKRNPVFDVLIILKHYVHIVHVLLFLAHGTEGTRSWSTMLICAPDVETAAQYALMVALRSWVGPVR